jgi:predicted ATP-dependent endonuclease of OLD family
LYYGVQDEVWDVVFALAERLRVQVFATTHSWDCIVGFQSAARRNDARGMLYRLDRGDDDRIQTTTYTEADVAIAAEQLIEVR